MEEREWKESHLGLNSNLRTNRKDFKGPVSSGEAYLCILHILHDEAFGKHVLAGQTGGETLDVACTGFRHKNNDVIV
jgi:hypothetical protein